MTVASINVVVSPDIQEIKSRLEKQRKEVANLSVPMAHAAVFLDQWVQKNFSTGGGNVGGWKPFSKRTIDIIRESDPDRMPPKLLMKERALSLSFLPRASRTEAGIGSELPYAKDHHEGNSGKPPARQLIPDRGQAKKDVEARALKILEDHAKAVLK